MAEPGFEHRGGASDDDDDHMSSTIYQNITPKQNSISSHMFGDHPITIVIHFPLVLTSINIALHSRFTANLIQIFSSRPDSESKNLGENLSVLSLFFN